MQVKSLPFIQGPIKTMLNLQKASEALAQGGGGGYGEGEKKYEVERCDGYHSNARSERTEGR